MSGSRTPLESPVVPPVPEVPTLPEHTIMPSIVEKKDFSPEELTLINTRLQSLEDTVKEKLKNKEAKLTLTQEKIAELKADLLREGAGDTKELTKEKVDAIIDEQDFENSDTTEQTPQKTLESAKVALTAFKEGKPEEALKAIEGSGIMPNNFMKKILEFFYAIFGDSRISMDQSTMFERQVTPAIESLGISLQTLPNKNDIKVMVMQKLATLGVPLEYSDRYFKYIQGSIGQKDIPQKYITLFNAGKEHYDTISGTLSTDPKIALESILDFTPPAVEPAPTINTEKKETEKTALVPEKVKIGEKDITGTPEEIQAYTTLEKTAKNILGKNFDAKSSLTAVKQGTESELTTISRDIFFKIVSKLQDVYGPSFSDSLTGKDITDDDKKLLKLDYFELNKKTPKTMADTLEKNLGNIFWSGVRTLEKSINNWAGEDGKRKEIAQKLLLSIKGYQSEGTDKGAPAFQSEIAKGYDRLIVQNMEQTTEWKKLRTDTLKDDATAEILDTYYTANPILKISETV